VISDRPNEAAWQRLDDIYRPLIRHWLRTITGHHILAHHAAQRQAARAQCAAGGMPAGAAYRPQE